METCKALLIPMKFLLNPNGDRKFIDNLGPLIVYALLVATLICLLAGQRLATHRASL